MRSYPNIEKSAFRPKTYIGYAASGGNIFYITRYGRGWNVKRQICPGHAGVFIGYHTKSQEFHAGNMSEVSDMLARL